MTKSLKILLFVVPLSFSSTTLFANQLDFSSLVDEYMNESNVLKQTINLSGKQRMFTQRMTKLAIQIDLNIQKKSSIDKLKKISSLYTKTLMGFKNGNSDLNLKKATNSKVIEQIAVVEKKWKPFEENIEKIITGKDDGKALKYLIDNNEELLKLSNALVTAYEASNTSLTYLEKARLRVVNVAGRQRMLTQKMTKEKLLILKGNKEYESKMKKTVELFDTTLTMLIKGDKSKNITKPTNEKIINQLKVVLKLWNELKPLYLKEKNSAKELAIIFSKNSTLLKDMNTMVKLAEEEVEY